MTTLPITYGPLPSPAPLAALRELRTPLDALTASLGFLTLVSMIFWIWMLVDCVRNETPNKRTGWAILIAVLHVIGAFAYYFGRRKTRLMEAR